MDNDDLQQAFDGFVLRHLQQSSLEGEERVASLRRMRETFADYRQWSRASLEATDKFLLVRSTCSYVGYPGDNQFSKELPASIDDAALGGAVREALRGSRTMMLDFLSDKQPALERDQGLQRRKSLVAGLLQRHGYRSERALFKAWRLVYVALDQACGEITLLPTHRYAVQGYQGAGTEEALHIGVSATGAQLGALARVALGRCTDTFGN